MKPVNLLPDDHRPRRATGERSGSAYGVIGALAVIVAMAALYVLSANQVSERQEAAAQAQGDAQAAQAQIGQLGAFGNFSQIKQVRVASVKSLAEQRFDWERFVRELALVLPDGTWLSEVSAGAVNEEEVTDPAAVATGPTAKLLGCAPRQPDVAELMVRLRKVHRVEDVKLTESSGGGAESTSASSSGATCGSLYSFDVAVTFTAVPPSVDGAGANVPVKLGGGS